MTLGLDEEILCFNVESEPELEALSAVASARGATAPIAIRVNPDVDARTHAKIATGKSENKFGVPISRAREVYARARALPGLSIRGVDMHIGSQITDLEPFDNAFALLADFVRVLRADGHAIDHVDLGGGLGIPYRVDNNPPPFPEAYAEIVARHTKRARLPGLSRAGPAHRRQRRRAGRLGHLRQERRRQELRHRRCGDERPHAPDPLRRPSRHPARAGAGAPRRADDPRRRGRPGLRKRRLLALDRDIPEVAPGDLLAVMSAGAYGAVQAGTYNSRLLVPEVLVKGADFAVDQARGRHTRN